MNEEVCEQEQSEVSEPVYGKERELTNQEILQQHEIRIKFYSVGCVVNVGCKAVPFNTVSHALKEINDYVENPREARKKWSKILNEKF